MTAKTGLSQRDFKDVLEDGKLLLPRNLWIIAINQMIIKVLKPNKNIECGISMMNDIVIIMSCWDLSKTHIHLVTSLQYIMSFLILHWFKIIANIYSNHKMFVCFLSWWSEIYSSLQWRDVIKKTDFKLN